ncbi:hypothetical protein PSTT_13857 [Puccinia striiformis]|uniref:Uncharacterized protein n=1 Tax=Puccinia striiformis TaxID=27350 RepID=A0A2S4UPT2_9BASI|nr:hypothetical protein PSTT_13857 [Puccinia striiformis]
MPPKKSTIKKKATTKKTTTKKKTSKKKVDDSSDDSAAETPGHLKKSDYLILINWLKIKKNYEACFGTGKAPPVGRPVKGTINGFELMAINLRNQSPSKINLTAQKMKDRFNSYKDKYKKAHTEATSTGFGLTAANRKAGVRTIEEKLEKMCPNYSAMNKLMVRKPFVTPLYKADAQDEDSTDENDGRPVEEKSSESESDSEISVNSMRRRNEVEERTSPEPENDQTNANGVDQGQEQADNKNLKQSDEMAAGAARLPQQSHQKKKPAEPNQSVLPTPWLELGMRYRTICPIQNTTHHPPRRPKKKKHKYQSKSTHGLTAAELALDESTDDDQPTQNQTTQNTSKDKRRASNSNNINPKSHHTPGSSKPNPFGAYEGYANNKEAGKAQVAREGLGFEMFKFDRQMNKDDKGVELEGRRLDHTIALDQKKWDQGIEIEEKKLTWEKEERAKDRQFEIEKLDRLASQDNVGKKYELVTKCIQTEVKTEEIMRLAELFK